MITIILIMTIIIILIIIITGLEHYTSSLLQEFKESVKQLDSNNETVCFDFNLQGTLCINMHDFNDKTEQNVVKKGRSTNVVKNNKL